MRRKSFFQFDLQFCLRAGGGLAQNLYCRLCPESLLMTPSSRLPAEDADEMPQEVVELGREVAAARGPRHRELQIAYERVVESIRRRRRILALVQEALSQLRLDIKYLMFDLEATRSERDALRQQRDEER